MANCAMRPRGASGTRQGRRLGGDEFAILLPHTGLAEAQLALARVTHAADELMYRVKRAGKGNLALEPFAA